MDTARFSADSPGDLVRISGTDPHRGPWEHSAFLPLPLATRSPDLSPKTYRAIADARAALAALDSTAQQLPNPRLLRRPALRAEAQSTSALEGTYAPLQAVLTADEDRPGSPDLREILNYVVMADTAFAWNAEGRRLTLSALGELQSILVNGTSAASTSSGAVRDVQVVIGRRPDAGQHDLPVQAARFVPSPPGPDLSARLRDLLDWMSAAAHEDIDPVVATAMAHYQFETLHPFHDGNGRVGRLLIVVHLLTLGVLSEPTLTVSPWFETQRERYYNALLGVSADNDWDTFVRFFAAGLEASAVDTRTQMLVLVQVQAGMKEALRRSSLRADTAHALVDYAVTHTSFTVRAVARDLDLSYGRANTVVGQLVELGVLMQAGTAGHRRRFYAPRVLGVLTQGPSATP